MRTKRIEIGVLERFREAAINLRKTYREHQHFCTLQRSSRRFYHEQKTKSLQAFSKYEILFSDNYNRLQDSGSLVLTYPKIRHYEANQIFIDGLLSGQSYQDVYRDIVREFDRMIREASYDPTLSDRLISSYEKDLIQVYNNFGSGCVDIIQENFGNPAEISNQIDKFQMTLMKSVRKMLNKQVSRFWQQGIDWAEINLQKAKKKKKEEYEKPDVYIDPNQAAVDALIERNLGFIKGMTEDAKKEILSQLTEGMLRGEGIDQLVKRLAPYVEAGKGKGQSRAEMIARTEVMYGLNQGAIKRYGQDGIEKVQWLAGPDDRMCPVCGEKNGSIYKIGTEPSLPYHPNCLLPDTRCVTAGDIVSGLRSWYDGPVFEIVTSAGSQITVTPNHMFLTTHGFCAAQFLREGDDIINCSGFERIISENPDDHQTPTRIEDIFNSLVESGSMVSTSMPSPTEDLHGDARFTNGKIDIVFSDCFLSVNCESTFQKHFSGGRFNPTCKSEIPFFSESPLYEFLFSAGFASDGGMSGSRQSDPIFRFRGSHPGIHTLTPVSGSHSILLQDPDDNRSGDIVSDSKTLNRFSGIKPLNNINNWDLPASVSSPNFNPSSFENPTNGLYSRFVNLSDLFSRFSGFVKLDNIISIRILPYSGYVYDLQTLSTVYIGSSFLISNCRCTWVPYFDEYANWVDDWSGKHQRSDVENYGIYDEYGNLIGSGSGTSTQVEIQGDTKDKTVIHNHPGTTRADFSIGDMKYAFSHDVKEMVVVTPTGSRCSISRPKTGWPEPDSVEPAWKEVMSAHREDMKKISADEAYGKITLEEGLVKRQELLQPVFYKRLGLTEVRS